MNSKYLYTLIKLHLYVCYHYGALYNQILYHFYETRNSNIVEKVMHITTKFEQVLIYLKGHRYVKNK